MIPSIPTRPSSVFFEPFGVFKHRVIIRTSHANFPAARRKHDVPVHFGMFDELTADIFESDRKVVPEIYKEIDFGD